MLSRQTGSCALVQDAHPPLHAQPEAHGGHAALDPGPVQAVEGLLEAQDAEGFPAPCRPF